MRTYKVTAINADGTTRFLCELTAPNQDSAERIAHRKYPAGWRYLVAGTLYRVGSLVVSTEQ
jgi:hypothetical protein